MQRRRPYAPKAAALPRFRAARTSVSRPGLAPESIRLVRSRPRAPPRAVCGAIFWAGEANPDTARRPRWRDHTRAVQDHGRLLLHPFGNEDAARGDAGDSDECADAGRTSGPRRGPNGSVRRRIRAFVIIYERKCKLRFNTPTAMPVNAEVSLCHGEVCAASRSALRFTDYRPKE